MQEGPEKKYWFKLTRVLQGNKPESTTIWFRTDEEFDELTLVDFRKLAEAKGFMKASDRFVYEDRPVLVGHEDLFPLKALLKTSVRDPHLGLEGTITVWSKEYIEEWEPSPQSNDSPAATYVRLKISRVLRGNKPQQTYKALPVGDDVNVKYEDVTLSDFRSFLKLHKSIEDTDRFPHDDKPLELREEGIFRLAELVKQGQNGTGSPNDGEITLWSQEYIEERGKPAETVLTLTVKRKPAGLGDKTDKTLKLHEAAFNAMKLDELRTKLLGLGYIAADDQFVDQGVAIETDKEAARDARSIAHDNAIVVWNKTEIDRLANEEAEAQRKKEWEAKAPKITPPEVDLVVPKQPDHTPAADHTGDAPAGLPGIKPRTGAQVFSQLSAVDVRAILTDSRLYPDLNSAPCCAALSVGDEIEFARDHIVTCESITTKGVGVTREDNVEFTYSEEVAKWHRQLVSESAVDASVPLLFAFRGKYIRQDGSQTFKKNVEVCLTASIALPKARVILNKPDVSDEFTQAIEETTRARDAQELLRTLAAKGHFVATDFLLGGKVICSTRKVLEEDYSAQQLADEFRLATQGSLDAEGVPVTMGGASGYKNLKAEEKTRINQRYGLKARTYGGFGESSGSNPKELGKYWLETVRDFPRTWTVIGINGGIRPSLSYLAPSLQKEAKAILRQYFDSKLTVQQAVAGNVSEKPWGDVDLSKVRRIAGVNLHLGALVDGVQIVYEMNDNSVQVTPWHGQSRKELKPDASFKLEPGDEIEGVEVGYDKTVDHLIFWTKDTHRYPPQGQYGGKNAKHRVVFGQPRIRGFHGMAANYLDAFGVKYLDLTKRLDLGINKSALLSLERYIYSPV